MNTRSIFSFIITFIILSVSAQQSDIDIINNYLDDNIEKFSYQTKDINEIFIKDKIDSNNSFISLYVQQKFNGIDIFNAISTVAINNNKVVSFANRFQSLINNKIIPAVVFTDPEVAWCGLTESDAKKNNIEIEVARFPWRASGRAHAIGRTEGMTKIVQEPKTKQLLGVGIVGYGAGELIGEGVLAINMGAKAEDLSNCIHPHPTLSETIMESADVSMGIATHIYKRPRK